MTEVNDDRRDWGEMTLTFEIASDGSERLRASSLRSHDGSDGHEIDLGPGGHESVIRRKGEVLERKNTPGHGGTDASEQRAAERFRCFLNNQHEHDKWSHIAKNPVQNDICDVFVHAVSVDYTPLQLQITEADPDSGRWWHHAQTRAEGEFAAEKDFSVSEAAGRLLAAISKKENKPNYSLEQKRRVILLLNAEFVPEAIDQRVRDAVRWQLPSSDFLAIFIVGSGPDRIYELCSAGPPSQLSPPSASVPRVDGTGLRPDS